MPPPKTIEPNLMIQDPLSDHSNTFEGPGGLQKQRSLIVREGKNSHVPEHKHDGEDLERLDIKHVGGLFQTISVVPTLPPKNMFDQIKIYSNAGAYRLYVYNTIDMLWQYATLT